jgi:hypothetical protein
LEFDGLDSEELKGLLNDPTKKRLITIVQSYKAYSILNDFGVQ